MSNVRSDVLMASESVIEKTQCSRGEAIAKVMKDPGVRKAFLAEATAGFTLQPEEYEFGILALMHAHAAETGCSLAVALSEIAKTNPELWHWYSEKVMERSEEELTVIPLG